MDVNDPDRPVYLLGESFGAVLALAVAAAKTDLVDRLVLVNPATSYENSIWPRLGPALAKLPDVRPVVIHRTLMHSDMHSKSTLRAYAVYGMLSIEALLAVKACMQAAHASVLQNSTSVLHSTSTTALNIYASDPHLCGVTHCL